MAPGQPGATSPFYNGLIEPGMTFTKQNTEA
jgi:hypothetical protein